MRLKVVFLLCAVSLFSLLCAETDAPNHLRTYMRFDRDLFFDADHVPVEIVVENGATTAMQFLLYDMAYTTFQPIVYDVSGREASIKVAYRLQGLTVDKALDGVSNRTISLAPGESYSCRVNLAEFYTFVPGRKYKARNLFLKDAKIRNAALSANTTLFSIDIAAGGVTPPPVVKDNQPLGSGSVRPEEIVHLFLLAEQKERWSDYIKYVDVEQYIYSFPGYAGAYVASRGAAKRETVDRFIEFVSESRPDNILSYQVLSEIVTYNQAQVEALVERASPREPFFYKYTYLLEKKRGVWTITGVTASVARDIRK